MIIQNEFISINIETAGRRLASVLVQDKINGRSYDLGKEVFTIQLQEAKTDEACSKKEYTDVCLPLTTQDLMCGELSCTEIAADAAARHGLSVLAEMPIDPALAALVDAGDIESFQGNWLDSTADLLEK